jgi:hypothetical protein
VFVDGEIVEHVRDDSLPTHKRTSTQRHRPAPPISTLGLPLGLTLERDGFAMT